MQAQKRKPKRQAIPEAIERVVRVIETTIENLSDMVRIGEDVKEVPHYKPGTLWVERIIRPIYRLRVQPRFVIDNNPVENSIRPMAIGRKKYLFCGNHTIIGISYKSVSSASQFFIQFIEHDIAQ